VSGSLCDYDVEFYTLFDALDYVQLEVHRQGRFGRLPTLSRSKAPASGAKRNGGNLLFLFENYVLDSGRRELRLRNGVVEVEPQVFDVLEYLVRNRDRVVTRDDLIEGVWHGRIVSESTLDTRISSARYAVGDSGKEQRLIRTLARKGIRFVGSVREGRVSETATLPTLPGKPSIAVLPFQNIGGDTEQEYFADGIVEDIITALSRFKSLFVIARNSTFIYKGKVIDTKRLGEDLGVRYVLEGSVRKAGDRLRITGQLIEAGTNSHIWADNFDGAVEDIFELQDQITTKVVGLIAPQIEQAEIERAKRKVFADLDSHDYFMRGMALINQYDFSEETRLFFQKAWKLDPDYAAAYAMDAWISMNQRATFGKALSVERRDEAVRLANTAADLANDDALVLARAAHVLVNLDRQFDRAMSMVDKAVALNPNHGGVWHARSQVAFMCCNPDECIRSMTQSIRFNPKDPATRSFWIGSSWALWMKGQYEEGLSLADKAIQFRATPWSLGAYILNAVSAGHIDQAREAMKQSLTMAPHHTVSRIIKNPILRDPKVTERVAEIFRIAGMPE
jgi:TolB-like protein/Flp pilus assembly protein TadD